MSTTAIRAAIAFGRTPFDTMETHMNFWFWMWLLDGQSDTPPITGRGCATALVMLAGITLALWFGLHVFSKSAPALCAPPSGLPYDAIQRLVTGCP